MSSGSGRAPCQLLRVGIVRLHPRQSRSPRYERDQALDHLTIEALDASGDTSEDVPTSSATTLREACCPAQSEGTRKQFAGDRLSRRTNQQRRMILLKSVNPRFRVQPPLVPIYSYYLERLIDDITRPRIARLGR